KVIGRLARKGLLPEQAREISLARLPRAFLAAGEDEGEALERLVPHRPTPGGLLWMAPNPQALRQSSGARESAPVCGLLGMLAVHWERINDPGTQASIAADFPAWKRTQKVCSRCAEVYAEGKAVPALSSSLRRSAGAAGKPCSSQFGGGTPG